MKKNFYLLVLTLMLGVKLFGQQSIPPIWEKKYGGSGKDRLFSAIATSDGNYLVLGMTDSKDGDQTTFIPNSANLPEIWVLKINGSNGTILWRKLISEKANLSYYFANEPSNSLVELSDSYALSLISTYSVINNLQNVEIIKLNKQTGSFSTGNLNVSGVLGVGTSISKTTISKYQINSGSFIIGASNYSADARLLLINSSNTISKTVTKPSSIQVWGEYIQRIEPTPDGGYLLFGSYGKNGIETYCGEPRSSNVWVAKFDQNLTLVWSKDYGGKTEDDFLDAIILPNNGFYLLGATYCGQTGSNVGPNSIGEGTWLMQLDQNGNVVSQPRFINKDGLDETRAIELNCKNEIVRIGSRVEKVIFDSPSWDGGYYKNYLENFIDVIRNPSNNTYLLYGNALTAGDDDYFLALKGPEPGCGTTQTNFCTKATKVACGIDYPNQTTVGAGNALNRTNYAACSPPNYPFDGPERVYEITLNQAGELQVGVEILDAGVDLDLFLLGDNCQTITCLAKNTEDITCYLQEELPAGKYYVVVDGYNETTQGRFNINFACNPLDCNTSVPPLLKCGVGYDGSTYERTNNVSIYRKKGTSTLITNVYGSEAVHKITLKSRQEITIAFNRTQSNLMLFLLESNCNKNAYLDRIPSGATGTSTLKYTLDPGDYYLAVDGLFGAAGSYTLTYTSTVGCTDLCSKAEEVFCGSVLARSNETIGTGSNDVQLYTSCTGQSQYLGKEKVYKIKLNTTTSLQVGLHLLTPGVDLDLFLITTTADCSQINCYRATASGISRSKYLLRTLGPGTYYFAVDALGANTQGSYRIDFACGELNCNVSTALSCRAPNPGSSFTGSNDVSIYGVKNGNNTIYYPGHIGKEKIYQFDVFEPQTITLTLAGQLTGGEINPDLSLFLFSTCNKTEAIASSVTLGSRNESISIQLNPGTYYAVVDEFLGSSGNYSLSIQQTQPCANICDYGGELVYRGVTVSNAVSSSELAPTLLYYESCVKTAFGGSLAGKKLYAEIYSFYNDEANAEITLNLNSTLSQSTRGFIFQCSNLNATCKGFTTNGQLKLTNNPIGYYYVVILSTGNPNYSFTITPRGVCQLDPETVSLNAGTIARSVTGRGDDFNIGGGKFNGYSNCYNGFRTYRGEDVEFQFTVEESVKVNITLNANSAAMGMFLYGYICGKGCINYAETGANGGLAEIQDFSLSPGTYYIIVDKNTLQGDGQFTLEIETTRVRPNQFFTTQSENCPQDPAQQHTIRIVKPPLQFSPEDKLYFLYPDPANKNKYLTSFSRFWDTNEAVGYMDIVLNKDVEFDGRICSYVENDSIYIALERKSKASAEYIKAFYDKTGSNPKAAGRFKTNAYGTFSRFELVKPSHFRPSYPEVKVKALQDDTRDIDFLSSDSFYIQIEPAVSWVRVTDPGSALSPHPPQDKRIFINTLKNLSATKRDDVKIVFISTGKPSFRSEVIIKQEVCSPFDARITSVNGSTSACVGQTLKLKAEDNLGNNLGYSFQWVGPNTNSTSSSIDVTSNTPGFQTYNVTITGTESQCRAEKTAQFTINYIGAPIAPIATQETVYACANTTIPPLTVSAASGLSVNWYNGAGIRILSDSKSFSPPSFSQPGEYFYYAEARNAVGCTSSRIPIKIIVSAAQFIEGRIESSINSSLVCTGTPVELTAKLSSGSSTDYLYDWSTGSKNTFIPIPQVSAGEYTYSVTVSSKNNQCLKPTTFQTALKIQARPSAPVISTSVISACSGVRVAPISVNVSSGISVNWYNNTGQLLAQTSSYRPPVINTPGEYIFFAEASNESIPGCKSELKTAVKIEVNPSVEVRGIIVSNPNNTSVCTGTPLQLQAIANTGSTTGYSFKWTDGETTSTIQVNTSVASNKQYTVTVSSNEGKCQTSIPTSITIEVKSRPVAPTPIASIVTECTGTMPLLSVNPIAGSSIDWFASSDVNESPLLRNSTTYQTQPLSPGEYVFYAEARNSNGCASGNRTPIKLNILPKQISKGEIVSNAVNNSVCLGETVTLGLRPTLGSLSDYAFEWEDNRARFSSRLIPTTQAGTFTYTLKMTGAAGKCFTEEKIEYKLTVLPLPEVVGSIPGAVYACLGQKNAELILNTTENAIVDWYDSNQKLITENKNPFYPNIDAGEYTYYAQLRSKEGCVNKKTIPLQLIAYPKLTLISPPVEQSISCYGGLGIINLKIRETVTGGFSYAWPDRPDQSSNPRRTNLKSGNYPITVSYGKGCQQKFDVPLPEPDSIKIVVINVIPDTSSFRTGAIKVEVSGGTSPYDFRWKRNGRLFGTEQNLKDIPADTYQLEVYDVNNCYKVSQSIKVNSVTVATSTIDHPWESLIKVFPNPTNGKFTIALDLPEQVVINPEIINALGESILRLPGYNVQKGSFDVDLTQQAAGIYFVKLNYKEGAVFKRVLLLH